MRLQQFLIADRVDVLREGPGGKAAKFLRDVTLADMQRTETWLKLRGFVQVKPRDDILPARSFQRAGGW